MSPKTRRSGARSATSSLPRLELPVVRFELSCGATLLVSTRPGAPVCAVQAHIRGGHSLDPEERGGTAYLAGKLVDLGTKSCNEEELAGALETMGAHLSGGSTGLAASVAGDQWKAMLELFADCLTEPDYPREKLERQRKRLLDRLLVERDEPRVQGAWLFRRLVYGDHWLGRSDAGTLESVAQIRRQDVTRFHARNWCGARTVIAFCGDVDPKAVYRFLNRRLGGWKAGQDLPAPAWSFPDRETRVGVVPADRQQVHVFLGHLGIRRTDPDYAPLVVMDHVLGTGPGFTSRISRRLRDEQGLAYTVDASIHPSAGVLPGTFTAYIGTSPDKVEVAVRGFLEEMRTIQNEEPTPDEVELAKNYLVGSFAMGFERAARRASYVVSAYRNGLPADDLQRLVERFAAVTPNDVQRVAREHLYPEASCLVAAGPTQEAVLQRALGQKTARRRSKKKRTSRR